MLSDNILFSKDDLKHDCISHSHNISLVLIDMFAVDYTLDLQCDCGKDIKNNKPDHVLHYLDETQILINIIKLHFMLYPLFTISK